MRTVILGLAALTGALLAALLFQQIVVEGSFGPAAMVAAGGLSAVFLALVGTLLLSRTRYRAVVANVWLAVFSVAISYFALDLAAGWALIRPLSPPLVPDAVRHHRLVPDSYAEFQQRDFSYIQRVNTHGLRGKEFTTEKAPGTYRIIMLGDSFTMGKGVEDDQTFSVVLEENLRRGDAACGRPIEVLNAGVDSYAPILGLLYLTRDLTAFGPDMVVYNLDVSDLIQEAAYRRQGERGPDGEIVAVPQHADPDTFMEKVRIWTERHLFFTRVLLLYANRALGYRELNIRDVVNRADSETVAHTLEGDVDRTAQWRDVFDSLARMKRFCEERGIAFVLSVYPWAHQLGDDEWVPGRYAFMPEGAKTSDASIRTIHDMAAANGIELADVTATFKAYDGPEPLYFQYDMHWTAAGHRVMAKGLGDHLVARRAAEWCR